ncbi:hypothetical protein [Methanobrevibacter sp.]|uniref:hypothetical protein n=1 Tax=Methanobrevibacter sp. TaxID=66852 RepID=UPI0026DF7B94|nr:hypothetical protein [Methanobrevibacter sp.]MDO5824046.1 hypothetical protein [Methanobrevibacter sp.]
MGQFIRYECDVCGYEHIHDLEVFWIDKNLEISVSMLVLMTSREMSKALVSGYYYEYYCYDCQSTVREFSISENSSKLSNEEIINIIEDYGCGLKIIKFDNKFQNCIYCSKNLKLKSQKEFAFDKQGNFIIEDSYAHDFVNNNEYSFWGRYYGYYCEDCKKQINKFVVMQNQDDIDEDSIRYILKQHTHDLTVLLFDYNYNCPGCRGNLHSFDEEYFLCPKCREGYLIATDAKMVD